jgi:dihydroxyacetone kinase-like protein
VAATIWNFDIAGEIVEMEGIETTTVRVADDVASASLEKRSKRRGVSGLLYAFKMAGAKAKSMAGLQEVTAVAQKAADSCRSVGVALTPCTVPAVGKPTFELSDEEMEIGMGIHGEPGVRRRPLRAADLVAQEMLSLLLSDMPLRSGERISVLVNSLGATPLDELCIVYRYVARKLAGLK